MCFREQGGRGSAAAVDVSLGLVRRRPLWRSGCLLLLLKLLLLQAPLLFAKLGPPILEPHLSDIGANKIFFGHKKPPSVVEQGFFSFCTCTRASGRLVHMARRSRITTSG